MSVLGDGGTNHGRDYITFYDMAEPCGPHCIEYGVIGVGVIFSDGRPSQQITHISPPIQDGRVAVNLGKALGAA